MKSLFGQSSLVPLSKIANAPSKSIRILWIVFSSTMFIGLLACIGLVVKQYFQQQTIFQLDYSGKQSSLDNCPSISICFVKEEVRAMFFQALRRVFTREEYESILRHNSESHKMPWLYSGIDKFYEKVTDKFHVLKKTIANTSLVWSSRSAASRFYSTIHNFSMKFEILPHLEDNHLTMNVYEQIPHVNAFLCTGFEFYSANPDYSWSSITVTVDNELDTFILSENETDQQLSGYKVSFIIHERGSLPFSSYDRHIRETVTAGKKLSVFLSKSITNRLNTKRNPCQDSGQVTLFGHEFEYGHDACGWQKCCENCLGMCNCTCEMDVLRNSFLPCPPGCMRNVCLSQISYSVCPISCTISKYNKNNVIEESAPSAINKLCLIKSENVHIATEEDLYTLTKLCSEIGGLCSLFIGFSCIFVFEIFEAFIVWRSSAHVHYTNNPLLSHSMNITSSPHMSHFLYNNTHSSRGDISLSPIMGSSSTIIMVLLSEGVGDLEYQFHSDSVIDKVILHEHLRLGKARIKLL